jgi:hypothetical protein
MKPSRTKRGGFFFSREMYLHPACLSLSKNAMKALIALLDGRYMKNVSPKGQKKKYTCMNAENLRLTYILLEKIFRIPRGRIPSAIDELMEKGFMERKHGGGSARHDQAIYALSEKWRFWTPGAKPFQVREVRQHHGYQGRPLGAVAKRLKKEKSANIAHETEPIHTHELEPIPTS